MTDEEKKKAEEEAAKAKAEEAAKAKAEEEAAKAKAEEEERKKSNLAAILLKAKAEHEKELETIKAAHAEEVKELEETIDALMAGRTPGSDDAKDEDEEPDGVDKFLNYKNNHFRKW